MTTQPAITPADYDSLTAWFNLIRHMRSIVVCGAPQFVTVTVIIDSNGKPQMWGAVERHALFPRAKSLDDVAKPPE